ncbi:hypothetical protein EDB85DRAFT_1951826 [Lactarius pseudohatsudake]|nr:hypothetical protein EDB85DRAFT_1951826 [Lactarius pseudohatsudake]
MNPSPDTSHLKVPEWQPRTSGSPSGPACFGPSMSPTLWENVFEVHPDTPQDDPVYGLLGVTQRLVTPRWCTPCVRARLSCRGVFLPFKYPCFSCCFCVFHIRSFHCVYRDYLTFVLLPNRTLYPQVMISIPQGM